MQGGGNRLVTFGIEPKAGHDSWGQVQRRQEPHHWLVPPGARRGDTAVSRRPGAVFSVVVA